jgi:hypothetical protein
LQGNAEKAEQSGACSRVGLQDEGVSAIGAWTRRRERIAYGLSAAAARCRSGAGAGAGAAGGPAAAAATASDNRGGCGGRKDGECECGEDCKLREHLERGACERDLRGAKDTEVLKSSSSVGRGSYRRRLNTQRMRNKAMPERTVATIAGTPLHEADVPRRTFRNLAWIEGRSQMPHRRMPYVGLMARHLCGVHIEASTERRSEEATNTTTLNIRTERLSEHGQRRYQDDLIRTLICPSSAIRPMAGVYQI